MKEKENDSGRYVRVGITLYKIVRRPLMSGDFMEVRVPWNYETLRQDHSKDFISQIEKYDGFCSVPSHTNYRRSIGTFLNRYEPINYQPAAGDCPFTFSLLSHIFGEQMEMGLDYLHLLSLQPLVRLPIIILVSIDRNTGKTTFLNFLKAIFAGNMTFNTNEDFHSQFNSDWANKLVVGVDEALLVRREDSERIKNLSTAISYKVGEYRFFYKKSDLIAIHAQSNNLFTSQPKGVRRNQLKKPFLDELAVSRSRCCALLKIACSCCCSSRVNSILI
jgi:hypothetical protein